MRPLHDHPQQIPFASSDVADAFNTSPTAIIARLERLKPVWAQDTHIKIELSQRPAGSEIVKRLLRCLWTLVQEITPQLNRRPLGVRCPTAA
jgi:hypothetical protein